MSQNTELTALIIRQLELMQSQLQLLNGAPHKVQAYQLASDWSAFSEDYKLPF